jgi:hypothetical protein
MAEAIRRDEWDRTAMICKTIADVNRPPNAQPYSPEIFHPMHWRAPEKPPAREVVQTISGVFKGLSGMRGEP